MLMAFSGTGNGKYGRAKTAIVFFSGPDKAVPSMPSSPMFAGHGRFFRGNMADAESLHLAKAFCPGIRPDATHEEFVEEGQSYLEENGLVASDPEHEGHALLPVSKTDSSF